MSKAVKMVDGIPKLGSPKSYTSRRVVPVAPKYRHIALWLRENGGQAFLWCAPRRDSLLYATYTVRRKYYKLLARYPDVRPLSPHCCRHTYVTLLQSQGVPMETIARLVFIAMEIRNLQKKFQQENNCHENYWYHYDKE